MSTLEVPVASLRPVWDAVLQAASEGKEPPETVTIAVDPSFGAALARAGWVPVINGGRRTAVVRLAGEDRALAEMSDADLQRWLLAREEGLQWMMESRDEATLHARAQSVTVPLVAMALGIETEAAWDIAPTARREIVHVQEQLNESRFHAIVREEWMALLKIEEADRKLAEVTANGAAVQA